MTIRDTFSAIVDGDQLDDGLFNSQKDVPLKLSLKNHVRDLINSGGVYSSDESDLWGDAYVDANGRNNSLNSTDSNEVFLTNKMITYPYVIIEATSLTIGDFAINNCVAKVFASGKWLLRCTSGSVEVQRAQIIKTLFYGTDGTDDTVTGITSLTALKTNITRDVGKRGFYASMIKNATGGTAYSYTATFANTSSNNDSSIWGNLVQGGTTITATIAFPIGTNVLTGDATQIGTDQESDEQDNPANFKFDYDSASNLNMSFKAVGLCVGTISYVESGAATFVNTDFNVDHSVPDFTASSETEVFLIVHDIPSGTFGATISSVILSPIIADFESGADIQFKLTNATEDSGYLTRDIVNNFTAFTSEPTKVTIKLIPKSTTPTVGFPSIRGFGVYTE